MESQANEMKLEGSSRAEQSGAEEKKTKDREERFREKNAVAIACDGIPKKGFLMNTIDAQRTKCVCFFLLMLATRRAAQLLLFFLISMAVIYSVVAPDPKSNETIS